MTDPSPPGPPPDGAPPPSPSERDHWLYRLSPDDWLRAADHEVALCAEALHRRAVRPGVTHARRAAGMAWNAVLARVAPPAEDHPMIVRYGRSYMDHVKALADDAANDDGVPEEARAAARLLRDTPPAPPDLIKLGKPDLRVLEAARTLVEYARGRLLASD
ncbi:MAG TPA: hypothetical protein VIU64_02620 [Polyangia bacterium]